MFSVFDWSWLLVLAALATELLLQSFNFATFSTVYVVFLQLIRLLC
jgi:hypothetical protein